jgi:hypothetical protein
MNVLKLERERIIEICVVLVNRSKVEKGFVVFVINTTYQGVYAKFESEVHSLGSD